MDTSSFSIQHSSFVHLHTHTHFSLMRGTMSPETLCRAARDRGFDTLAITDTNGLYGLHWFLEEAREYGLRPIIGAEATAGGHRAVLLARTREGYAQLCACLTALHRSGTAILAVDHGLAASSAERQEGYAASNEPGPVRTQAQVSQHTRVARSRDTELHPGSLEREGDHTYRTNLHTGGTPVLHGQDARATSEFHLPSYLRDHTTDDLIVLSDDTDVLGALAGRPWVFAELQSCRGHRALLRRAAELGVPPVATAPAWFLDPDDFDNHRLLRAIDRNTTVDRTPAEDLAPRQALLHTAAAMARAFSHCPEAVANTRRIAEACCTAWDFSKIIFPDVASKAEADAHLRRLCDEGARRRYGRITPEIRERLEHELGIITDMGFANYFLVVEDIVRQSPRTCGRGSAAASIVSYCLGITHVDPVRHRLFFERFLNRGRKDPPDIDVDFAWDERDRIFDYVFEKYGNGHGAQAAAKRSGAGLVTAKRSGAGMIANHVCLQPRAAFREVAKVYGMPEGEIKVFSDRLRYVWGVQDIEAVIRHHPMFRDLELPDPWPEILKRAQAIAGAPRYLSVHCGGVVITPDRLDRYVPVETAPKGVPVIQWEKDQAEAAGLVKIDLLSNRSLAVIRDALAAIKEHYGVQIEYAAFNPIDDLRTRECIRTGDTLGCFYIESPATRQLLQKTNSGEFENLVVVSSIIRPAANREAREYVRRLHGGAWKPIHPVLEGVLEETFGIMVYQEDVSRTAIAIAGFNPAEADDLRKVLTKKHKGRRLQDFARRFVAGARARQVPDDVISTVWNMMMSFAGYSFCKPHSASYALVSFKSAYLRAHYPAEFLAAVISNQGGYYRAFAYCSDAVRMGLELLPPDINDSDKKYRGRNRTIRMGFMQIKGLPDAVIDKLLEDRRVNGPFGSPEDFCRRVDPDPSDARLLLKAGCFDSIGNGRTRPEMMWALARWEQGRVRTGQVSLLDDPAPPPLPQAPQYDEITMLRHEAETLGFLVSRHPLTLYQDRLKNLRVTAGRDLPRHVGRIVTTIGWYVTSKLTSTKNEETMAFYSFEDTTALYETTFFPRAYERFCALVTRERPFLLRGKVEEDFGAVMLNVNYVELLDEGGRRETATEVTEREHEGTRMMRFFPV